MKRIFVLLITHVLALAIGFAAGVYVLPILIAPPPPAQSELTTVAAEAMFSGEFRRDLQDSDAFHWGEGTVSVSRNAVSLKGRLAPGPDYKLYLSPEFVETEADFERVKPNMVRAGDVKTFENFVVPLPPGVDPAAYNSVVVWCESFAQFITAAKYR